MLCSIFYISYLSIAELRHELEILFPITQSSCSCSDVCPWTTCVWQNIQYFLKEHTASRLFDSFLSLSTVARNFLISQTLLIPSKKTVKEKAVSQSISWVWNSSNDVYIYRDFVKTMSRRFAVKNIHQTVYSIIWKARQSRWLRYWSLVEDLCYKDLSNNCLVIVYAKNINTGTPNKTIVPVYTKLRTLAHKIVRKIKSFN